MKFRLVEEYLFEDSKSLDNDYLLLAKDPEKNEKKLKKLIHDEAIKNGYTMQGYHGTYNFTTTTFNKYDALFLTDSVSVARNFSGGSGQRNINGYMDIHKISDDSLMKYAENNTYITKIRYATSNDFKNEISGWQLSEKDSKKYFGNEWEQYIKKYNNIINIITDKYNLFKQGKTYFYMEFNSISHDYPNDPIFSREVLEDFIEKNKITYVNSGGVYSLYFKVKNPISIECNGSYYTNIPIPKELIKYATKKELDYGYASSDQILRMAFNGGYGCVEYLNMREGGDYGDAGISNVYAVIDSAHNVKSSDIITYDDNGNIIPLSKRFNDNIEDIRESI